MPIQSTTDCGSETIRMFALAEALRFIVNFSIILYVHSLLLSDAFSDLSSDDHPAHWFLWSINNITVERGWYRLRVSWGDNIKVIYQSGSHLYNPSNSTH